MKMQNLTLFLVIFLAGKNIVAQSFEGTWKGTSICQVKNSPCHDENVVFYISKDNTGKKFEVNGNKIVEGKEVFMGTLEFTYDEKEDIYVSINKNSGSKWEFKITGDTIKGTLKDNGTLFRLVDLKKVTP